MRDSDHFPLPQEGRLARSAARQQLLYCSILAPHPPYYSNATYLGMIDAALITKAGLALNVAVILAYPCIFCIDNH